MGILLGSSSCRLWNPNQMFRTAGDYEFTELPQGKQEEIVLGSGDRLTVQVNTNRGYSLLTPGLDQQIQRLTTGQTYEIDVYGYLRLPFIDTIMVSGMKLRDCERALEDRFKEHFKEPFAQIRVVNRRVFVFRGNDIGQVVPLDNDNMTLIEVLAAAGGVPQSGKAYKIKIVRTEDSGETKLFMVDLRNADEIERTQLLVRHRDIVYIDPTFQTTLISQLLPLLSFITTIATVILLINTISR